MSKSLNISEVADCIKNIVGSNLCTVCDKSEGKRGRYSCGHTACYDCLKSAEVCLLCLTPSDNFTSETKFDAPLSLRVKNVSKLLSVFQDTFMIDVYKRQKIFDQLKLEKDVFPACIQAPVKYFNKRKSSTSIKKNKENYYHFYPGEQISPTKVAKMENSKNYVNQWFNRNESSRPSLADLNVNINKSDSYKYSKHININKTSTPIKNVRKRLSTSLLEQQESKSRYHKKVKKSLLESSILACKFKEKNYNDESGIVLDDTVICIEDSQCQTIDKDKLALLAVEAAARDESGLMDSFDCSQINDSQEYICISQINVDGKLMGTTKGVPFYKKSALSNSCSICNENGKKEEKRDVGNFSDISISIDNQDYITTISVINCAGTQIAKKSAVVQTDISDVRDQCEDSCMSDDLFHSGDQTPEKDEKRKLHEHILPTRKNIILDDSDTDACSEENKVLQVTADVHRSCKPVDYGILTQINLEKVVHRKANKVRGITPDSSNSSDKENFDPNKRKKRKNVKKNKLNKNSAK